MAPVPLVWGGTRSGGRGALSDVVDFVGLGGDVLAEFALEKVGLLEAYGAPYGLAVLEEDEGGHALHAVFCGEGVVAVDVYFDDVGGVANAVLDLFEDGSLHLAGAAPGGEEVNQCGLTFGYDFIKIVHGGYVIYVNIVFELNPAAPNLTQGRLLSRVQL